jgi:uncharacterized membrane protein
VTASIATFQASRRRIRRVPMGRPWTWLAAGARDLATHPGFSIACGLMPVVAGWSAIMLLVWFDLPYFVLPLGAGFFFAGPFLAVCLYEISRRREFHLLVDGESVWLAWLRNPGQIALMGILLMLFHLVWMGLAKLLFALFEWRTQSWDRFADFEWFSSRTLPFLAFGIACGAALAAIAFAVGAFAMPYLLHRRNANCFEAIATSVTAVRFNLRPMALWASLIVLFIVIGLASGLLGLVIVLPVVAYASWHAYRDIVIFPDEGDSTVCP